MHYKFNFGEAQNPVEGFVKITGDTLYTKQLGYGLTEKTDGATREYKVGALKDFLHMKNSGFRLDVKEEGTYNVRLFAGDVEMMNDFSVFLHVNGDRAGGMWISDKLVNERVISIELNAGTNELTFEARGDYIPCISSIEIAPLKDEAPESVSADIEVGDLPYIILTWDEVDGATGYVVYAYHYDSDVTRTYRVVENTFVDKEVEICEEYIYTVHTTDEYGFDSSENVSVKAFAAQSRDLLPPVTGLKAEAKADSVSLKWNAHPDALFYYVYQKPSTGIYKKLAKLEVTEFVDNEVITAVDFRYAVVAVTKKGLTDKALILVKAAAPAFKRKMETLDRGAVALPAIGGNGMFVSWRVNAYEYAKDMKFNLYRNGEKLNTAPLGTNFEDKGGKVGDEYVVKAIVGGKEEAKGYKALLYSDQFMEIKLDKPAPYTVPSGETFKYSVNDMSVADLDGDGEYELILKWDCHGRDNAHSGYSGPVIIDAFKLDGTKLWRIDLGINIRCGAHYTQFMVYDFDGDGKAEMILKTADGSKDSKGNIIGDASKDYRNTAGYILEGDEFLTLIDGLTGEFLDTIPYTPPRGKVSDWGDGYGNRVDRFLACVAYLDGVNPSAVMCRGYYDRGKPTHLAAYNVINKKLKMVWHFKADYTQNIAYTSQGNHNIATGDVDGDGRDEIIYGACCIDHDGKGIYSTRLGHGDALHFGKFNPDSEGYDYMQIHEAAHCPQGLSVRNPATGEWLWGKYVGKDTGRGITAKIDPRYRGAQVWAHHVIGYYSYEGEQISGTRPGTANFCVWWDGDLLRELLDHRYDPDTHIGNAVIYKWNWEEDKLDIIFEDKAALAINGTKGNPCIQADIFGDWREEFVVRTANDTALRIYTTIIPTDYRFYTFMHDPLYRLCVAWQNSSYNQPPHISFYLADRDGYRDLQPKANVFTVVPIVHNQVVIEDETPDDKKKDGGINGVLAMIGGIGAGASVAIIVGVVVAFKRKKQ
jgi:fibronectin type 3 domain-containing protein